MPYTNIIFQKIELENDNNTTAIIIENTQSNQNGSQSIKINQDGMDQYRSPGIGQ
jgi:hypothetical protein